MTPTENTGGESVEGTALDQFKSDPGMGSVTDEMTEAAERTAEREKKAADDRRAVNEAAYQASIEGQELPPSVRSEQRTENRADRQAKARENTSAAKTSTTSK